MQEDKSSPTIVKNKVKMLKGTPYAIPETSELGKGSFGVVKKVYDLKRTDLDLAVKIIKKINVRVEELTQKEFKIIEQLPYCINLVNYKKYCLESQNHYYFIMEYCSGGSLQNILNNEDKIFSENEIIDFLVQFLNGYRMLLKNNILHRDVKPGNILIHNGIYKICDFGYSKIIEKPQSDDNVNDEFLQLSVNAGSPFFQSPELFKNQSYDQKIDVYSLGITLFQMLFSSPNRIENEKKLKIEQNGQNSTNTKQQQHPFFNVSGIKDLKQFHKSLIYLQENQNKANQYLDNYISTSLIKRSDDMVKLLKQMINLDHSSRISFEELFNHQLFKVQLDRIQNDKFQQTIWNEITTEFDDNIQINANKSSKINEIDVISNSNILNVEDIQRLLLQKKFSICEEMHKQKSTNQKQNNSYLEDKIAYYQTRLSDDREKTQLQSQLDTISNITISIKQEGYLEIVQPLTDQIFARIKPFNLSQVSNNKTQLDNDTEKQENNLSQQQNNEEKQNNEEQKADSVVEEIDIEDKDDKDNVFDQINQFIKQSDSRIRYQHTIKRIEDVLLFFRQICFNYKNIATELSKSYHIVKNNKIGKTQTDFITMFDHVSLLSLIMFKQQITNLKNNYDKLLLDRSLYCDKDNKLIDQTLFFTDEDIQVFNISQENKLFMKTIEQDIKDLEQELDGYLSQEQLKIIFENYKTIVESQQQIKEIYKHQIQLLIKQGIEEFGFLEKQQFEEFQKTLLYLTEIDLYEKNQKHYFQMHKFSRGSLLLRFEQIEQSDDSGKQLSQYCESHGIRLIAYVD